MPINLNQDFEKMTLVNSILLGSFHGFFMNLLDHFSPRENRL